MDITLVTGCFDPLHAGHILMLEEASRLGYPVVVGLTGDAYINKPGHPILDEYSRMQALLAIRYVDDVRIYQAPNALSLIEELKPKFYVKGREYQDHPSSVLHKEEELVRTYGGQMYYTCMYSNIHSSILEFVTPDALKFLSDQAFCMDDVYNFIDFCKKLNVLVVGEAIIDTYIPIDVLGLAPKTTALACREIGDAKVMMGGAAYVARMVAQYCKSATLLTYASDDLLLECQNIDIIRIPVADRTTAKKTRYMHGNNTILMLTNASIKYIDKEAEGFAVDWIIKNEKKFDLVLVADFGHGLLTPYIASRLSRYRAATVQSGESNYGICDISKYKDYDYLSLSALEVRFAFNDMNSDIASIARHTELNNRCLALTSGKDGCIIKCGSDLVYVPCVISSSIDPIGAGDTFFAISALANFAGLNPAIVGFLGNCAAGMKTNFLCTSTVISPLMLINTLERII